MESLTGRGSIGSDGGTHDIGSHDKAAGLAETRPIA
jgi:hypothetical protein